MSGIVGVSRRRRGRAARRGGRENGRERVRVGDLRVGHLARPREAILHARAERRLEAIDQGAVGAPGLAPLQVAKAPVHRVEAVEQTSTGAARPGPARPARAARAAASSTSRREQSPEIGRRKQTDALGQRRRVGAEQDVGDAREGGDVAREPAARVEARREVEHVLETMRPCVGRRPRERSGWPARAPSRRCRCRARSRTGRCEHRGRRPDDEPPVMRSAQRR